MIDPQLAGKVALVTGANHGIGAATVLALARQGVRMFITYYRGPSPFPEAALQSARASGAGGPELYAAMQQQPVDGLLTQIRTLGVDCAAVEANLEDADQIPQLFSRCEDALGPVDLLVANHTLCVLETFDPARVTGEGFPVSMVSQPVIDAHFAVNARACALLIAEYTRRYLERKATSGRIITLSTDAAHAHEANVSYAASKHAIESYSRSAAAELGPYGITVNIVAPGPIQTGYITPQGG